MIIHHAIHIQTSGSHESDDDKLDRGQEREVSQLGMRETGLWNLAVKMGLRVHDLPTLTSPGPSGGDMM